MKFICDNIKPVLGIIIVLLGFLYYFVNLLNHTKPNDQILIAIVASSSSVISYYFGSSTGQSKKDDTIDKLANK